MGQNQHSNFVLIILFVLIIEKREVVPEINKQCVISQNDNGLLQAYCDQPKLTAIPQNLNSEIEEMILVDNNIAEIRKNDLQMYKNLIRFELKMDEKSGHQIEIHNEAFKHLKLEYLKISGVDLGKRSKILFPKTIRQLHVISSQQTNIGLQNVFALSRLEIAEFYNNSLYKIPTFHGLAPLNDIDVTENPLVVFSVKYIAKYCQLKTLVINIKKLPAFMHNPCECPLLKDWIEKKKIEGIIPGNFKCFTNGTKCDLTKIQHTMKQLFDNCLNGIYDSKIDFDSDFASNDTNSKDKDHYDDDDDEVNKDKQLKNWLTFLLWPITISLIFIIMTGLICILLYILKKNMKNENVTHASIQEEGSERADSMEIQ